MSAAGERPMPTIQRSTRTESRRKSSRQEGRRAKMAQLEDPGSLRGVERSLEGTVEDHHAPPDQSPKDSRRNGGREPEERRDDLEGSESSQFGYSQKYFHISDGNLYSVFSPLQGRSYGVKPSFLRKHGCVQVSRGKRGGRRGPRLGLKFHNFVPSESAVTLEREEPAKNRKPKAIGDPSEPMLPRHPEERPWRAPPQCLLREENGSKQICLSHVSSEASGQVHPLRLHQSEPASRSSPGKDQRTTSVLQQYLESRIGPQTRSFEGESDAEDKKHRRKPAITKRVVPYRQYLRMLDESPLDLSAPPLPGLEFKGELKDALVIPRPRYALRIATSQTQEPLPLHHHPPSTLHSLLACRRRELPPGFLSLPHPSPPAYLGLDTSFKGREEPAVARTRKPSQRSIIRKKLEDTFKQNGFLVKTRQVSDGDATFCKFKQLRKYTRYYLKSWVNHLPEEVNKLWKGFLPPTGSPGREKRGEEELELANRPQENIDQVTASQK